MMTVDAPRERCIRCGTCCRKSSPTLHAEDAGLFECGALAFAHVYTLRAGEFAADTIRGGIIRLDGEMVKIREQTGSRTCMFFDEAQSGCRIYATRPVQCRTLECWNPGPLVDLFAERKLTRRDLIPDGELGEIVALHERRTSFAELGDRLEQWNEGRGGAERILEILNYDIHVRDVAVKRGAVRRDDLPFFFGRPMLDSLAGFGCRVEGDPREGFRLIALD